MVAAVVGSDGMVSLTVVVSTGGVTGGGELLFLHPDPKMEKGAANNKRHEGREKNFIKSIELPKVYSFISLSYELCQFAYKKIKKAPLNHIQLQFLNNQKIPM
jgi:hypothetical protein